MTDNTYNGWTNYETWVWNLWIDNDQGWQEYWREVSAEVICDAEIQYEWQTLEDAAIADLAERLESECDNMAEEWMADQAGPFADLLNAAIDCIEWREIADHMITDTLAEGLAEFAA